MKPVQALVLGKWRAVMTWPLIGTKPRTSCTIEKREAAAPEGHVGTGQINMHTNVKRESLRSHIIDSWPVQAAQLPPAAQAAR